VYIPEVPPLLEPTVTARPMAAPLTCSVGL
jgi:hypothetical protein